MALAEGARLLATRRLDEARRHARDLAPATEALLSEQGWKPRDLNGVVVGLGPGSYTGLRVGVMSAKTLAYATGCRLLGVSTFAAVATQSPGTADRVDVLGDAQQDKVYVQSFSRGPTEWQPTSALSVVRFSDWLARREPGALMTGPGLHARAPIAAGLPLTPAACWDPRPESLLRLGLQRYLAGERDDVYALEPLYLRPSSAEEQWKRLGRL